MARKTRSKPPVAQPKWLTPNTKSGLPLWKSICLVILSAVSFTLAKLSLSPSHGSIPVLQYNNEVIIVFATSALLVHCMFRTHSGLQPSRAVFLQTILAIWTPLLQMALTPTARFIGPGLSALMLNTTIVGPMIILATNAMASRLEPFVLLHLPPDSSPFVSSLVSVAVFGITAMPFDLYLPILVGSHQLLTRSLLPFAIPPFLMLLLPSRRELGFIAMLYVLSLLSVPHASFSLLAGYVDKTLSEVGHTVIAREESVTGYISVIENRAKGYRVMRCDHSLLGGEWILGVGSWPGGESYNGPSGLVAEPVYAVFVMLEAIRLVQDNYSQAENRGTEFSTTLDPMVPDNKARALVM